MGLVGPRPEVKNTRAFGQITKGSSLSGQDSYPTSLRYSDEEVYSLGELGRRHASVYTGKIRLSK
jgi:hypothetical protein